MPRVFHPITDTCKVDVQMTLNGKGRHCILYAAYDSGGGGLTVAQAAAFANTVFQAWNTNIGAHQSAFQSLDQVTVTDMRIVTGSQGLHAQSGVTGSLSATNLPPADAACVTWKTLIRGRTTTGRSFIPGMVVTQVGTGGMWDPTSQASLQTGVTAFLAAVNGTVSGRTFALAVASRKTNPGTSTPIDSGLVRQYFRSQRRRDYDH